MSFNSRRYGNVSQSLTKNACFLKLYLEVGGSLSLTTANLARLGSWTKHGVKSLTAKELGYAQYGFLIVLKRKDEIVVNEVWKKMR